MASRAILVFCEKIIGSNFYLSKKYLNLMVLMSNDQNRLTRSPPLPNRTVRTEWTVQFQFQPAAGLPLQASRRGHPAAGIPPLLSHYGHPATAVLSQPSCHSHPVTAVPPKPSRHGHPFLVVLFCPPCSGRPVLAVLFWLSRSGCPFLAVLVLKQNSVKNVYVL